MKGFIRWHDAGSSDKFQVVFAYMEEMMRAEIEEKKENHMGSGFILM